MRLIETRDPPVHGDAEQVEDGGRGEDHVHGVEDVTNYQSEKINIESYVTQGWNI